MNLLKANHTGQPPLQSPLHALLQSLLPSWMDECISQSRRAGSQTAWPHACSCHMCRMPHAASAGSLARFMFNEMFGRFLENLHYTATTGPVAGRQPGLPLLPVPPPPLLHLPVPEKVHKMARSVSSSARRASELIHFASGTRQSHICGRQTRLSSFSLHRRPLPSPPPCSVAVGARIMHEVVIIRANSIENFVPNVRFAGGSSTSLPLSPILFPSLSYSFYCSLSSSSLSPPSFCSFPACLVNTHKRKMCDSK